MAGLGGENKRLERGGLEKVRESSASETFILGIVFLSPNSSDVHIRSYLVSLDSSQKRRLSTA